MCNAKWSLKSQTAPDEAALRRFAQVFMQLPDVPSDGRFRILVVEDDPSISKLIGIHLKMAKFDIFAARDGLDAWSQFSTINPHLVLTDIHMPNLSGHELVERVRGISAVPIVMMTAADTDEAQMRGFKNGADDYIAKPFNPKLLTARILATLRRVYRYDADATIAGVPLKADVVPSMGLASGFAKCEACSFIGPVARFEARDVAGHRVTKCPNCGVANPTFAVG